MTSDFDTASINMGGHYSFSRAAKLLGVHRSRVYGWTKKGRIPYYYDENGRKFLTGFALSSFYNGAYDPDDIREYTDDAMYGISDPALRRVFRAMWEALRKSDKRTVPHGVIESYLKGWRLFVKRGKKTWRTGSRR